VWVRGEKNTRDRCALLGQRRPDLQAASGATTGGVPILPQMHHPTGRRTYGRDRRGGWGGGVKGRGPGRGSSGGGRCRGPGTRRAPRRSPPAAPPPPHPCRPRLRPAASPPHPLAPPPGLGRGGFRRTDAVTRSVEDLCSTGKPHHNTTDTGGGQSHERQYREPRCGAHVIRTAPCVRYATLRRRGARGGGIDPPRGRNTAQAHGIHGHGPGPGLAFG